MKGHGVIRRRITDAAVGLIGFTGFLFFVPLLFWVILAPAHATEWYHWVGLILSAPCAYAATQSTHP